MCGIFGVWNADGTPVDRDRLIASRDTVTHRGPDDAGVYVHKNLGLAHRRLSIIDLSLDGRQPMCNETEDVWVVFNGEIYNFQSLRAELEACGHRFKSKTDSEVIVHGYEQWGEGCFERFNGMFAIGLWDARARKMILARGPLGKKPLYYHHQQGRVLLFGSTLKPLMAWPDFPRQVDENAVYDYLKYGYVPAPKSMFRDTYQVLPGHYVVFENDSVTRQQAHWDLVDIACKDTRGWDKREEEYVEELHELLRDAVRLRMVSDVPLGAFLSGGIDSSLIVALMSEVSPKQVRTYTIGFSQTRFDESDYAHQVAKILGVENTMMVMSADDMLSFLPDVVSYYDEPMADFSLFPTLAISELARRHVSVALTGDGGDEVFAGYNGYLSTRIAQTYCKALPQFGRSALAKLHPLVPQRQVRSVLRQSSAPDAHHFYGLYKRVDREFDLSVLIPDDRTGRYPEEEVAEVMRSYTGLQAAEAALLYDVTHSMVDAILHKVDRASMAFGLEARSPLLDKRVVEFAFRLPLGMKLHGFQKKYILRKLLSRYLPRKLIERPKKGFAPPLREWFRNELRPMLHDCLSEETIRQRGYFRPAGVQLLLQRHLDRRADHTRLIWALLMLELWFRRYL